MFGETTTRRGVVTFREGDEGRALQALFILDVVETVLFLFIATERHMLCSLNRGYERHRDRSQSWPVHDARWLIVGWAVACTALCYLHLPQR